MAWELDADRPIYAQLVERIQREIVSGQYRPGEKLPSVRDLAAVAAVNPNTMQKAYAELERSGLIVTQRTSGRTVTEDTELIRNTREQLAVGHVRNFINNMQELAGAEVAGIKLHAAIDVTMKKNHIHHCTMGIWCDWQAQGTRITQSLFHNNHAPSEEIPLVPGGMSSCDIFIEVSHGPTLIDHNICLSKLSFKLASQGCAIVHNLCLGQMSSIGSGSDMPLKNGTMAPRYTPYHIKHRTEVAGMMTFLHGDDRIYNNIFIQNWPVKPLEVKEDMGFIMMDNQVQGTSVFDDFPTYDEWIIPFELDNEEPNMFVMQDYHFGKLPVWINGNAYFNGAKAWKNEKDCLINEKDSVYVKLLEKDGNYILDTNVYEILGKYKTSMINSDILGEAFEPEERFENPDGSTIVFNRDYFGNERGLTVIPGPFANPECVSNKLL